MSARFNRYFSSAAGFTNSKIKKVAVTGSTGLLGTKLVKSLESKNVKVLRLTTSEIGRLPSGFISWNPAKGFGADSNALEDVDVVINLAGENVGSGDGILAFLGRWSDAKKDKILTSRVDSIKTLAKTIANTKSKPKVFITASAIGYYGYTDNQTLFEESASPGTGFLANVCVNIEKESKAVESLGIRTVPIRLSAILSPEGGILQKLLLPFKLGLGGNIGDGSQGFSWVTVDDAVRAIEFIIDNPNISGPVNVTAPQPTNNAGFTTAFGRVLSRPTIIPMPKFIAQNVFGEFGKELLLGGQKVVPSKLNKAGFKFTSENVEDGIRSVLK